MASESARQTAAQAWCTPSTEKIDMIPELAEVFAETLDDLQNQHKAQLTILQKRHKAQLALRDARITQLESENDALSRRLHLQYSKPSEPATAGNLFWRRYVNGGGSLWRVLFDAVSGGSRLWRAMVRVGRRKA